MQGQVLWAVISLSVTPLWHEMLTLYARLGNSPFNYYFYYPSLLQNPNTFTNPALKTVYC